MPTLPAGALAALVVLALLAISLDMFALRDLFRRPTSQVVFANKWIWVAIILLASSFSLGAIIYLVAGRRPAVLTDTAAPSEAISVRTESVADALYGPRGRGPTMSAAIRTTDGRSAGHQPVGRRQYPRLSGGSCTTAPQTPNCPQGPRFVRTHGPGVVSSTTSCVVVPPG